MAPSRVLYVDDDPGLARLVRKTLEGRAFLVEHAASGDEALAMLGRGGIDAVALDHHMPGRTGLDLLADIRACRTRRRSSSSPDRRTAASPSPR